MLDSRSSPGPTSIGATTATRKFAWASSVAHRCPDNPQPNTTTSRCCCWGCGCCCRYDSAPDAFAASAVDAAPELHHRHGHRCCCNNRNRRIRQLNSNRNTYRTRKHRSWARPSQARIKRAFALAASTFGRPDWGKLENQDARLQSPLEGEKYERVAELICPVQALDSGAQGYWFVS